jgi:hypothetical protein
MINTTFPDHGYLCAGVQTSPEIQRTLQLQQEMSFGKKPYDSE